MREDEIWPTELRLSQGGRILTISWTIGPAAVLDAEFLRVVSPSAEVQGHNPNQRRLVGGKRQVAITAIDPVGNYAVRLIFDDGHNTGLYTWGYIQILARDREKLWDDYLDGLDKAGLSRDR